jgi:two-component system, NarL family, sensor kinase
MVAKIAHLPHPRLLDEVGLEAALYWYVDGFAKRSQIKVDLDYPPHYERLPGQVEIALLCIVEECLTNIHRHSGSQTASIRFTRSASEIIFEVRDDGKGIPPEKLASLASASTMGIGLSGMQKRLKQLGGSLKIDSNGHGTAIIATLPYDSAHHRQPNQGSSAHRGV